MLGDLHHPQIRMLKSSPPLSENVTYLVKTSSQRKSYEMILLRWALIQYSWGPYKKLQFGQTRTQQEEGSHQGDAFTNQVMPKMPATYLWLREIHGTDSPSQSSENNKNNNKTQT